MQMITIYDYLTSGKHIYDATLNIYDYINDNVRASYENELKHKFGELYLYTDDETTIKNDIKDMFALKAHVYSAIFNANANLSPANEYSETETHTGTVTTTDTGTVTNDSTPSTIVTTTENKNTADNGTLRAVGSVINSSTGTDTVERTDDLTIERTDDLTVERGGYRDLYNNIIRVLEIAKTNINDVIIRDTLETLTYSIYNIEDLTL